MGVESYLLRLRGRQPDLGQVVAYSQFKFGIVPDFEQRALGDEYSYYVFRDGRHVIEFEFFQAADGYEVSLRFALCHPSSVDRVFVEVALSLMSEFYLTATICEELPKDEPREYTSRDRDRFITNCCWSIARSRLLWRQMFGMEEAGLSVSDALRRYFMNNRADSV